MIRNSIDFADHTMRSLCICGAASNEGTSAAAVNLACAWAEHGARVMLVDVSLHEPRLHKLLGVGNDQGLIDHIMSARALEELLVSTSVPNLSILTAGAPPSPESGPPTLTPQHLGQLLIWARSNADIIILDTGPVLKSSDAALVARQADATVLVARQQHTSVRDLRRAAHVLGSCGEGLLGVVLTGVRSGASWDPMPISEAAADEGQTAIHRSAVSRQRKRSRHAA
jgi:capsular exopolysaccharide synthesis family protein